MNTGLLSNLMDMPLSASSNVIELTGVGKAYRSQAGGLRKLWGVINRNSPSENDFWALKDISFSIAQGEVVGIIGQNGAGKSSVLQIICGTLNPTCGKVNVKGRIAALLELGAGFNPEFTGRENLIFNGPLLGLSRDQILGKLDEIIRFSGLAEFVDKPVKTYSSGMFVRLAFALATSVEPEILVVDEALSVGDGEFAKKSFDRISAMRDKGVTILFCSHALYQIEAFCTRVIWIHHGRIEADGEPQSVIRSYSHHLAAQALAGENSKPVVSSLCETDDGRTPPKEKTDDSPQSAVPQSSTPGHARITRVLTGFNQEWGKKLRAQSGKGSLEIIIEFESDPTLPMPTAAISIDLGRLMVVTCAVSRSDGVLLKRDGQGRGYARIRFNQLSLRKGEYLICAYLADESAAHIYADSIAHATLLIDDDRPEPGLVDLDRIWTVEPGTFSEQAFRPPEGQR